MVTKPLAWRDGFLCAVDSYSLSDEPILVTHYWPLTRCSEADAAQYVGREAYYSGEPFFEYSLAGWQGYDRPRWRLADAGATNALAVEKTPIPRPKTRCETRYHNGRWEKYLKAQGFVAA